MLTYINIKPGCGQLTHRKMGHKDGPESSCIVVYRNSIAEGLLPHQYRIWLTPISQLVRGRCFYKCSTTYHWFDRHVPPRVEIYFRFLGHLHHPILEEFGFVFSGVCTIPYPQSSMNACKVMYWTWKKRRKGGPPWSDCMGLAGFIWRPRMSHTYWGFSAVQSKPGPEMKSSTVHCAATVSPQYKNDNNLGNNSTRASSIAVWLDFYMQTLESLFYDCVCFKIICRFCFAYAFVLLLGKGRRGRVAYYVLCEIMMALQHYAHPQNYLLSLLWTVKSFPRRSLMHTMNV